MKIVSDFDLTLYNAYRLGARCANAFFPETEEDFLKIYREFPDKSKIILGNGNNIILSKELYDEYFILLNGCFDNVYINNNNVLIAEAGATMQKLSEIALQHSLSGMEIFYDIPSSVGGAVVMNAGANGEEISSLVLKVRYLDLLSGEIKEKNKEKVGFEYRNSFFQKNPDNVVLKAWLQLHRGSEYAIRAKMLKTRNDRWVKQPRDYPNCGSVFKRPKGRFVGPMIDELGLKGFSIGGAQISEKHSGFIINKGNAKGADILKIISVVQGKVKEKFGVDLELEQRLI